MRRRNAVALAVLAVAFIAIPFLAYSPLHIVAGLRNFVIGHSSVEGRVRQYGPTAEARLRPRFESAGVPYPPSSLTIVVLKEERQLRLYAPTPSGPREAARSRILGASGGPGPKLREGDGQVPEGFYRLDSLNPNSLFHLALRVDYPNSEDLAAAKAEGRTRPGGDIMIHGKDASVGCIAIGDEAIEEVFVLAAEVGLENIEVVVSPSATPQSTLTASTPDWVRRLYDRLATRLAELGAAP
jgi:hypothetical protein